MPIPGLLKEPDTDQLLQVSEVPTEIKFQFFVRRGFGEKKLFLLKEEKKELIETFI